MGLTSQEVYEAFANAPQDWYLIEEGDKAFMVVSFTHSNRLIEFGVRELTAKSSQLAALISEERLEKP